MKLSNLAVRIISAAVLLPPIVYLILEGTPLLFSAFILVIALLASWEYGQMISPKPSLIQRGALSLLALFFCVSIATSDNYPQLFGAVVALAVPLLFVLQFRSPLPLEQGVPLVFSLFFGAFYTGALPGFIARLFSVGEGETGRYWVLLLAAAVIASDTFAYTFGRLFGKRKLAPGISPGKTWAGFFGGIFGACSAVLLAYLLNLPGLAWYDIFVLGPLLSLVAQLGDLSESYIKRGYKVKDSGKIIPGHGGILDRCDALFFTGPILFFSVYYWYMR